MADLRYINREPWQCCRFGPRKVDYCRDGNQIGGINTRSLVVVFLHAAAINIESLEIYSPHPQATLPFSHCIESPLAWRRQHWFFTNMLCTHWIWSLIHFTHYFTSLVGDVRTPLPTQINVQPTSPPINLLDKCGTVPKDRLTVNIKGRKV